MGRPTNEQYLDEEKSLAEVKRLAEKHQLELDSDTETLVKAIIHGAYVGGIGKMLTREWFLNEALKYWGELREKRVYASVTQRAFEVIAELAGFLGNTEGKKAPTLVDVTIDALTKNKK